MGTKQVFKRDSGATTKRKSFSCRGRRHVWAMISSQSRISKQKREPDGNFGPNKIGVPQNILTVKYILHAYDISYTTFKRMKKADNELPKVKAPHPTKGKSVFDSKEFAKAWYSPYRIYVRQKYLEWRETEVGQNADKKRKSVSCLCLTITVTQILTLTLTV